MLSLATLSTLLLSLVTLKVDASPVKRWYPEALGANYYQTNGFSGNQLVSSYIMPDGSLIAGTAECTYGNGSAGINDPEPYMNHPDPFYGSGSVMVSGCQVFTVNAGSNSFSVFDIDPTDPARPTFNAVYPSMGDFPTSLAASSDGSMVCVLNGGMMNGFSCYEACDMGWQHMPDWDRSFGLNLTTPPHGPVGGTPSQLIFSLDMSSLIVLVKGQLPTDLNNPTGMLQPGSIRIYSINNGTLSENATMIEAAVPFSIVEDIQNPNVYFMSDVTTGYAVFDMGSMMVMQGNITDEKAVCWAAQSPRTYDFYVVDTVSPSPVTEVSLNSTSLMGMQVTQHNLGTNSSGTDISIFSSSECQYDIAYVNAAGYNSVHAYQIMGPGSFQLMGKYNQDCVPMDGVVAGQAVFYKTW